MEDATPSLRERLRRKPIGEVQSILRKANILNGIMIALVYPLALLVDLATFNLGEYFSRFFYFIYCTFFGLLLVAMECNCGCCRCTKAIRENFGFLYSYVGRAAFLGFVASLCLIANYAFGYVAFGVTVCNAGLNTFVLLTRPEFREGGSLSLYVDPTKAYQSNSRTAAQLAAENPELTQKGVAVGTNIAKENPDLVMRAATAAARNDTNRL